MRVTSALLRASSDRRIVAKASIVSLAHASRAYPTARRVLLTDGVARAFARLCISPAVAGPTKTSVVRTRIAVADSAIAAFVQNPRKLGNPVLRTKAVRVETVNWMVSMYYVVRLARKEMNFVVRTKHVVADRASGNQDQYAKPVAKRTVYRPYMCASPKSRSHFTVNSKN